MSEPTTVPPGGAPGGKASSAPLLGRDTEPTLFELSHAGRHSWSLRTTGIPEVPIDQLVPAGHRREKPVRLAEVSERDLVAHFTRLSHRQFSVDLGAYPLGSCTMKYNPKVCDTVAGLPGLAGVHPAAPASLTQGWLALLVELEETLCEITGMAAATLQPAAGAAGELTGRTRGGLQRGGGHAGDLAQRLLQLHQQGEPALGERGGRGRVYAGQAGEPGHRVAYLGVVLHGARPQGIGTEVHRELAMREAGEVGHQVPFGHLGHRPRLMATVAVGNQ